MAAVKAKGKLVSIVINNEYIKICEITKTGKNVIVHKTVTIPTPEECYEDGILENIPNLASAIKAVMDEHRFASKDVAFSVSSPRLATKEVLIPNVKGDKVGKIVQANATEYFPVNMDEYIIQHTILEKVEDSGQDKLKLMVAAVPSEVAESYYNLAKTMGLKIAFIDYVGNSTVINIFKENVLQLQRMVPYGKSMLVNAVMERYELKYDAATAKLQNETLLHSRFDGDEVTESLRYMASNINRVIDYYVSRNRVSIQKAYLIGHSTTIKGFATLLSNELNMPIEKVETLKNITMDKKAYVEEATLTSYVTNLGAVFDPVDFVPKRMIDSGVKKDNTKTLVIALIGAAVVAAALVLVPLGRVVMLNAEISKLNKSIDKLSSINQVVDDYYSAKDKYNDVQAFAALTADSDDTLQNLIDYMEKSIPSDVVIQSINVASGSISISGKADSKASVAKLIQQLQANSFILNVDVPTITENKDNAGATEVTFSLSCSYIGEATTTQKNTTK